MGVSRVSFAPAEKMETMLGTKTGAATVFSMLLDTANGIRVVIDREVLDEEYYGCSDGTPTLTNEMGQSNFRSFERLACVISDIQNMGYEVILVSSGAIAVGTNKMNLKNRPDSIRYKQAAASVGQCRIIHLYSKYFQEYDKSIGQILLSSADVTIA